MQAVDRCANHRPAAVGDWPCQFVSQHCLADSVYAVDGDSDGMWASNTYDSLSHHLNQCGTFHRVDLAAFDLAPVAALEAHTLAKARQFQRSLQRRLAGIAVFRNCFEDLSACRSFNT